ncbi:hypothetical protein BpHYR1_052378 [Brachionus plicatilis]|uniref:Uncharacterized protein n=1 Tax=Brachionus plicatilis TaxID=10195 RepID=A0A3M7PG97_BRAPC|nr:hypothetical protein BpHYR1_052378 [Brachionus plicatilis]
MQLPLCQVGAVVQKVLEKEMRI